MIDIINLGMHPYADTFISNLENADFVCPLVLTLEGYAIRTKYKTNPLDRYSNYSYTSSHSVSSRNHWDEFFKSGPHIENATVIEIGSNDGYLAAKYLTKNNTVIGIDASSEMNKIAKETGIMPITAFFNPILAKTLKKEFKNIQLIISNNVLNHADNVESFVEGISIILDNSTKWIFEIPYWRDMLVDTNYAQIYHEHTNYFTKTWLVELLTKYNIFIEKWELTNHHGASVRVTASKNFHNFNFTESNILFSPSFYETFMEEIYNRRNKRLIDLIEYKEEGYSIIGLGASAKGNTLLNFHKLDNSIVDFVVDVSPLKIGKYTPLSRIPIYSDDKVKELNKYIAINLTSNINIMNKLTKLNSKGIQFDL